MQKRIMDRGRGDGDGRCDLAVRGSLDITPTPIPRGVRSARTKLSPRGSQGGIKHQTQHPAQSKAWRLIPGDVERALRISCVLCLAR